VSDTSAPGAVPAPPPGASGAVPAPTPGASGAVPAPSDPVDDAFHLRIGERLRAIRKQKRLSLNEVEAESREEFKASVLGAYERGERAISVLRLQRLAQIYGVTVDQLLPADPQRVEAQQPGASGPTKLRIDVAKLSTRSGEQYKMLERFLRMIQVQRQDFNGKVITVRAHDTRAIAVMLDVPVEQVGERLAALDLLFVPPSS
jgi:transcriptional regulator with XRE-family HTH domain